MNKLPLLLLPALVSVVGCQRPEVDAFRKSPPPIAVVMSLPRQMPGSQDLAREYAAAVRARLATRAMVVPEGVKPPEGAAQLQVNLTFLPGRAGEPNPVAVGVATGVAVGTLSALAGGRYAGMDGLFWGLWAGTNAAAAVRHDQVRMGYSPYRVQAVVYLSMPPREGKEWIQLAEFDVGSREVTDAMSPLGPLDRRDEYRIREEVGRALARVIVKRLDDQIEWLPLPRPSYYGLPAGTVPPEPPRQALPPGEPPSAIPPAPTAPPPPPPSEIPPPPAAPVPPPPAKPVPPAPKGE